MPRGVILCLLACSVMSAATSAGIWPEHLGPYTRRASEVVNTRGDDRAQWTEYGYEASEAADYGAFKVTASRFKDPTGAYAASLETPSLQIGNYTVTCSGKCPKDLSRLAEALPRVSHAALPSLRAYLPAKSLIPHSERYILGPASLSAFAPFIPAAAVAFQYGTEGELARYRTSGDEETLAIFAYPTPHMARQQAAEFRKLPGAVVRRSGPLVAIVPAAKVRDDADQLLGKLNYQASVSWDEPPPVVVKPQSIGKMMLGIFTLAGILVGFCVLSGLAFGGYRTLSRKFGRSGAQDPMILLHLDGK